MWYIFLMIVGSTVKQTDWMGGSGVLGPVNDWGTQYYASDSVTVANEGQVSLIATSWDYTPSGWVRHTVESSSGIFGFAQGFMPADIDTDGILDLVAHTSDSVVWYKHSGNYVFSKNVIGPANYGGSNALCIYPCDLDKDGDIDVLVATAGVGVGWYENQSLSWVWHSIDSPASYHRISSADVELDGDLDVVAVDNSSSGCGGDIYLFRDTTGSQDFRKELVADLSGEEGWRVYPQDFNNDGWVDLYSIWSSTYILLNDQAGHLVESWHGDFWGGRDFDGAWPSDINMDGDMDLVCGNQYHSPYGFYALLNDGTGNDFDTLLLVEEATNSYMDGAMARDIDLDGLPDIAGTRYRVGWFQQDPSNPLTFTLHDIEVVNNSHWIYGAPIGNKCAPSIDLLLSEYGSHIVYENQMLKTFASVGYLESSILEFANDSACTLKYFGYEACVPNDTALSFHWRAGLDSADIVSNPWNGPHYATVGMNVVDSFALSGDRCMFQYKAEFRGDDDIAVFYDVWLTYKCSPGGVEERPVFEPDGISLRIASGKLILYLPYEDQLNLAIYDVAGRLVKLLFTGRLCSGTHKFELPNHRSGIYFFRLNSTRGVKTLKFIR